MDWDPLSMAGRPQAELGEELMASHHVRSMQSITSCTTCHR
jgi:hypothetical protein